ncbi:MAG: hypothetical protein HOH43_19125 [Candidatus Latescibacteria bacterium]|jgi:hypothetical protein|nr:hypothetical protein [Candidatus Latescibacterota bacterium]
MRRAIRLVQLGTIIAGAVWFTGCGGSNAKRDLLSIELEAQQQQVIQLRALADTLSNTRTQTLDDLQNMMELNNMSSEQITVLEDKEAPTGGSIIDALKRLWPF